MADIVLYDETGEPVTYENVETLTTDTPTEGETATFTLGEVMDGLEVELNLANGDQTVTAPNGKLLKDLTIKKPETLVPGNIAGGVEIGGVTGTAINGIPIVEGTLSILSCNARNVRSSAFIYATSLEEVNLPECVSVGDYAFWRCNNIKKIYAPQCSYIGEYAFSDAFFANPTSDMLKLSDTFEYLGQYAFYSYGGIIPTEVEGSYTYMNGCIINAKSLPSTGTLSLPDKATCIGLTYRPLGYLSVTSVYGKNVKGIASNVFQWPSLMRMNFPNLKYIGHSAFSALRLVSVSFPLVENILSACFSGAKSLVSITMPNVKSVGSYAFEYCNSLTSLSFSKCEYVGLYAFASCSKLSNVYIPKCKKMEAGAFYLTPITEINVPECETIDTVAFLSCSALTDVYAPNCKSIGNQCFQSCYKLQNVNIDSCSELGSGAFYTCSKLSNLRLPKECKEIKKSAFAYCSELTSISIPGCEQIGIGAFEGCWKLSEISIPMCKKILNSAFGSNLRALKSVYLLGSEYVSLGGSSVFMKGQVVTGGSMPSFYFRESMLQTYKSMQYWSDYSSHMIGLSDEDITKLNDGGTL